MYRFNYFKIILFIILFLIAPLSIALAEETEEEGTPTPNWQDCSDEAEEVIMDWLDYKPKEEKDYWKSYLEKDGLTYAGILSFTFDPQGYVWIGTGDDADPEAGGVSILTPTGYFLSYTVKDGLPDNRINDILFLPLKEDEVNNPNNGGIWFATGFGLAKLSRNGKWKTFDRASSSLPDNRVTSLLLDDVGNLWVSTLGGGVAVISPEGEWKIYDRSNGLAGNQVATSFKDSKGYLWFGIWDGGITRFDGKRFRSYSMGNSGLVSNSVNAIAQNPITGDIWIGTTEGISVLHQEGMDLLEPYEKITVFPEGEIDPNSLKDVKVEWTTYNSEKDKFLISNFVSSLAFEQDGTLWIGYWGAGATRFESYDEYINIRTDNSDLINNYVGSLAIDENNNKWIGTYKGFSVLLSGDWDVLTGKPKFADFHSLPGRPGNHMLQPTDYNIASYHWKLSSDEKPGRMRLNFALPGEHYGEVKWSYSVFWGDGPDFDPFGLTCSINKDTIGNEWTEIGGDCTEADYLSYGYITDYVKPEINKEIAHPFPGIPEGVKKFLLSGYYIPSDNPDIYRETKNAIKETSGGDMYRTIIDIVYSDIFRDMPYDYTPGISENPLDEKFTAKNSRDVIPKPSDTLRKNRGVSWAKARLFCSMCKSAGIPARIIIGQGADVWSEVWIRDMGWIPVETGLPIYDYAGSNRLSFPKNFTNSKINISSISGSDDDTKSIGWTPELKASIKQVEEEELKKLTKLTGASLLIIKPAPPGEFENIPQETLIPLGKDLYMMIETGGNGSLKTVPEEPSTDFTEQNTTELQPIQAPTPQEGTTEQNSSSQPVQEPTPQEEVTEPNNPLELHPLQTPAPEEEVEEENAAFRIILCDGQKTILNKINLNEIDEKMKIKEGDVSLEFILRKVEDYIILEILDWQVEGLEEIEEVEEVEDIEDIEEPEDIEVQEGTRRHQNLKDDIIEFFL